jgi:AcrR family transcriptional regulator
MNGERGSGGSARPARARRHPPLVRRRLIVEAAREVIARRGMAATRMREVASVAGVSLGTLTYHFAGIDELLASVIHAEDECFLQPIVDRALAAETGREGLRCLVDGLLNENQRTREHWLVWMDFWTLASHDPRYGRWQGEFYASWREVVTELIARGEADGSLTVASPGLAVTQFLVLTDGVAAQAYLIGRESTVAAQAPDVLMWTLVADLFALPADASEGAKAGLSAATHS